MIMLNADFFVNYQNLNPITRYYGYTTCQVWDNILQSFQLSEDDQKKYATAKSKFDNHFVKN